MKRFRRPSCSLYSCFTFAMISLLSGTSLAASDSCASAKQSLKKVTHYHLHKTGGITINSILMSRYGGSQLHGTNRPLLSKALKSSPGSFYITYVRDPVAALLSRFFFWRACAVNKSYHLEPEKFKKVMCQSLDSYMRLEAAHNFMFDSLITGAPIGRCKGNSSSNVFEKPRNLKKGATWRDVCHSTFEDFTYEIENVLWSARDRLFVGITERFDEALLLFGEQAGYNLGIENLNYCPKNLVIGGVKKSELPIETLRMMESRNELDYALLNAAEKVLNKRKDCAGVDFQNRFTKFSDSLSQYQFQRNCSMSYLKSTDVSIAAKKKFKVEFLRPKLADPNYVDKSHKMCRSNGTKVISGSSFSPQKSKGGLQKPKHKYPPGLSHMGANE